MPTDSASMWFLAFILVFAAGMGAMFWFRRRDRLYLEKKTRDALGEDLKQEIEKEKETFTRNREKFNAALDKARAKQKR